MGEKEKVKKQQKKTLPVASDENSKPLVIDSQEEEKQLVKSAINRIKQNIELFNQSKLQLVKDMLYLQEQHKILKIVTGKTFEEFREDFFKYSKAYFYQLTGNYKFLEEHKKIELFEKVDTQVLVGIRKIKDTRKQNRLLEKAPDLTREKLKNLLKVKPSDLPKTNIIKIDKAKKQITIKAENQETFSILIDKLKELNQDLKLILIDN